MAKTEIITRAFNRLEYTAMCIRGIYELTGTEDYCHIIINQNSSDGTTQWLNSLVEEDFYKIKVKTNIENSGDAGGMEDGFNLIGNDCKYIMQFDNDCRPITNKFLKILVNTMDDNSKIGAIMMKREGVTNVIQPSNIRKIGCTSFGNITKGTCCMILRKEIIAKYNWWRRGENIGWGHQITERMHNDGYLVLKAINLKVEHIDGSAGQAERYPHYFNSKGNMKSNYTKVNYNKGN